MNCGDLKNQLELSLTIQGLQLSAEIKDHLAGCSQCREYYDQLVETGGQLMALGEIAMTPLESGQLIKSLNETVIRRPVPGIRSRLAYWTKIALRPALAGILVMLISFSSGIKTPSIISSEHGFDQFQLTRIGEEDLIFLVADGEEDILPTILDQDESSYITGQISSDQAAHILDEISAEEIEWLFENFTVEI